MTYLTLQPNSLVGYRLDMGKYLQKHEYSYELLVTPTKYLSSFISHMFAHETPQKEHYVINNWVWLQPNIYESAILCIAVE